MLVLFDLDGTLIDSESGIVGSMEHAFAQLGRVAPERAVLRTWIGPPLRETFPTALDEDEALVEDAVRHYHARFDAHGWSQHAIYDGIEDAIAALGDHGHTLAIVTTKVQHQAERIVAHLPFGAAFERVYGVKPDMRTSEKVAAIAQALADFDTEPADACMIGDRHFDIAGAHANRTRAIGAGWGFGSVEELRAAGADAIAVRPQELVALIEA